MFDDDDGVVAGAGRVEYGRGHGFESVHVVGGIGEYQVDGLSGAGYEFQCVSFDEGELAAVELLAHLVDEPVLCGCFFDCYDRCGSPAYHLKGYGAGAGKEVDGGESVEVDHVFQHVEQVFACEVCGGSCGYVAGDVESSAAEFSSTNPALYHPLTAAGNYLAHRNRTGDPRRSYALLAPDQMLLFGFSADGTLRLANRYGITGAADAAYFIMAATADHTPAAMLIGGDNAMRNEITPLLRTYMDPILPLTISDDLLHLRRMAPEAPVDMLMGRRCGFCGPDSCLRR